MGPLDPPLSMKITEPAIALESAGRRVAEPAEDCDRSEVDTSAVACDPAGKTDPRRVQVPRFVAPGNGKHA